MGTMAGPFFRADHVGSLLRPERVRQARARDGAVHLTPQGYQASDELKRAEDEALPDVVALQESVGLACVTDGELRRSFWHLDFLGALQGLELVEREDDQGVQFSGVRMRPVHPTIVGRA